MRRLSEAHGGDALGPVALEHLATGGKRLPVATQLAVGRLVERLASRADRARRKALARLSDFSTRAERKRFAAMLDSRPGRSQR